jgi:hypothetical protein
MCEKEGHAVRSEVSSGKQGDICFEEFSMVETRLSSQSLIYSADKMGCIFGE